MDQFITSDFYSAVVLRTLGFPLVELVREKKTSKKANFVFNVLNSKFDPQTALQEYWNGDLLVNAKQFVESVNEIKTRLYDKN